MMCAWFTRDKTWLLVFSREAGRWHMEISHCQARMGKWPLKIKCFIIADQQKHVTCFTHFARPHAGERFTFDSSPLRCSLPQSVCVVILPAIHSNALFLSHLIGRTSTKNGRLLSASGQKGCRLFLNTSAGGERWREKKKKERTRKRRMRERETGRAIVLIRQHERKPSHFLRGCQTIDYDFICQRTE